MEEHETTTGEWLAEKVAGPLLVAAFIALAASIGNMYLTVRDLSVTVERLDTFASQGDRCTGTQCRETRSIVNSLNDKHYSLDTRVSILETLSDKHSSGKH